MAAPATAKRTTQKADAAQEFDDFEAQPDRPDDTTGGADSAPPPLTLSRLVPEMETMTYAGRVYEMRLLPHFSVGRQSALVNHRNVTLEFYNRELSDEELTPDEEEQNRFHYRKIARAALPDLAPDDLDALTLEQLEAIASRFFTRSQEVRARAQAVSRPTSAG